MSSTLVLRRYGWQAGNVAIFTGPRKEIQIDLQSFRFSWRQVRKNSKMFLQVIGTDNYGEFLLQMSEMRIFFGKVSEHTAKANMVQNLCDFCNENKEQILWFILEQEHSMFTDFMSDAPWDSSVKYAE